MIKINLLPTEGGGARAARGPRRSASGPSPAPFYLLLALLYMGAAAAGYYVYTTGEEAARRVEEHKAEKERLQKKVAAQQEEFEAQNLRSQEIEEKYAVVEALGPHNRIFWSEKVNMIAMARLNLAVYVTKIELEEQIDERETPESVKRREEWKAAKEKNPKLTSPEPQAVKQPVINQTLNIQAIAYGNDSSQRLAQIRNFYENLNALEWTRSNGEKARFRDRMAPEFAQLPQKVDNVAGVDVLRFGFKINADPQLDRPPDNLESPSGEGTTLADKRAAENEVLQ